MMNCPVCKNTKTQAGYNYCSNCGRHLKPKWSSISPSISASVSAMPSLNTLMSSLATAVANNPAVMETKDQINRLVYGKINGHYK